jgi:hypothetical protein
MMRIPARIKDVVPVDFREKRTAQFVGVGIHLFRQLARDGRIVSRLLEKTRIHLREGLEEFLRGLPVDRKPYLPVDREDHLPVDSEVEVPAGRKGNLPVDREALKMRSQDPARLHRKEDSLGH